MKTTNYLFLIFTAFLLSCFPKDVAPAFIDPSDRNALSKVIVFKSNTQSQTGTLPTATSPSTTITNNPSVSLTAGGSNVYIPIQYTGTTPVSAAYLQIVGASTYFKIPISGAGSSGLFYIPMSLPLSVKQGNFTIQLVLVGTNGNVLSKVINIAVVITLPKECGDGYVIGGSGIAQTEHKLSGKGGTVNISYNTFDEPDRIDIYLDGKWVAGTGSSIAPPPPLSTCGDPLNGFVPKLGQFNINTSTSNKIIQVYVSGCTGGYTAWNYKLTCP